MSGFKKNERVKKNEQNKKNKRIKKNERIQKNERIKKKEGIMKNQRNKKNQRIRKNERIKKTERINKRAVNVLLTSSELANERITNSSSGIKLFFSARDVLAISPRYDEAKHTWRSKHRRHGNMIFHLDDKSKKRNIH